MPHLFDRLPLGPISLPNRIAVSPMCQYSAADGTATDWHLQHLMGLALTRAGMIVVEATGVERAGRITHGCLGLYSDANEAALARVLDAARRLAAPGTCFAIQIGHAGRKASCRRPWEGGQPLGPGEDPWPTSAPSDVPFTEGGPKPVALEDKGLARVSTAFCQAADRAVRLGFNAIELHMAHGYLLHSFVSPLSNFRRDGYGGSLQNRMRFPIEVTRAVRARVPRTIALGARITGTDWADGGLTADDAATFGAELKAAGLDYVCVSGGGAVPHVKVPVAPSYQVPMAAKVKAGSKLATRAVGMILEAEQADGIVSSGQADFVALARALLDDPRWVWHAADRLGAKIDYPSPYARVDRSIWPGAAIVHPKPAK